MRTDLWGTPPIKPQQREPSRKYQAFARTRLSCLPDHTAKIDLFKALQADEIGMTLTESLAMNPASNVSGF